MDELVVGVMTVIKGERHQRVKQCPTKGMFANGSFYQTAYNNAKIRM